jgi:hypothetical protein
MIARRNGQRQLEPLAQETTPVYVLSEGAARTVNERKGDNGGRREEKRIMARRAIYTFGLA